MRIETLEAHLASNLVRTEAELASDIQAEYRHVVDPSQCGSIVRRHFDALTFGVLAFVGLFILTAIVGIAIIAAA